MDPRSLTAPKFLRNFDALRPTTTLAPEILQLPSPTLSQIVELHAAKFVACAPPPLGPLQDWLLHLLMTFSRTATELFLTTLHTLVMMSIKSTSATPT
jgi:hypothetical protein